MRRIFIIVSFVVILLIVIFILIMPIFFSGQRLISPLENIHSIPFAKQGEKISITEALAHADIFLKEPVLAKQLALTITLQPQKLQKLSVGIRESSFWLSYNPITIYDATVDKTETIITKTITIPLTDKLQDSDKSIDLMFFANDSKETNQIDLKSEDQTEWQLISLTAEVKRYMPTKSELKDYIKSVLYHERAL